MRSLLNAKFSLKRKSLLNTALKSLDTALLKPLSKTIEKVAMEKYLQEKPGTSIIAFLKKRMK